MNLMDKTLFIASFPDLGSFDFSKTGISVGNIDNSDYFFNNSSTYIHSYIESLKKLVGSCDVLFVPANDKIISSLSSEGIKCIVLYPNIACKDVFIQDLLDSKMEEDVVSTIRDSWDFIISRLDKKDYSYKFVMGEEDKVLDILKTLISKKHILGVSKDDIDLKITDDKVDDLFKYCLLREDEFNAGKPSVESVFCEGIKYDCFFSVDRVYEKQSDISSMINSIKGIDRGISVGEMGVLKDDRVWTTSIDTLEKVMVLGLGTGDLVVPFSRSLDSALTGKVPYVIKKGFLKGM